MKEPKLSRKLNRACKLSEEDIENIHAMRSMDLTLQEIADQFKVTKQAIYYILKSDDEKKIINKRRHLRDTPADKVKMNQASAKARKYKRVVLSKEMKIVQKTNSAQYRKNHPNYSKKANKKHYYKKKINGKWYGAAERAKYRNPQENLTE